MAISKDKRRNRIHLRIKKTIKGSITKPRLSVFRSNREIYAQLIDDFNGITIVSASSREKEILAAKINSKIIEAKLVGKLIAERALKAGHKKISFDRSGYLYHGRVKSLAEGARDAGLNF